MNTSVIEQRILIYSDNNDHIDRVVELCEACESGHLRIAVGRTPDQLADLFHHQDFALAFVDMENGVSNQLLDTIALRLSPKPTIALVDEGTAEALLGAMRNGADSVFTQVEMNEAPAQLVYCIERQLQRASRIDDVNYLRDSLSISLEELKADQIAAREIQERLLPDSERTVGDLSMAYAMQASMVLSGDFIDFIRLRDDKVLFYLADVSGHGASSALVTVLLKNVTNRVLRSYNNAKSEIPENPKALLELFNRELLLTSLGKHLTIFVGVIDPSADLLDYAVGGHHPMPVLVEDGSARELEGRGMPIGLFETPVFERHKIGLPAKFQLYLFSDGVLEVLGGDNLTEKEQNLHALCEQEGQSPQAILETVTASYDALPDDVAVMMVSRQ